MVNDTDLSTSDETPSFLAPRRKRLLLGRRAIIASAVSTIVIIGGLILAFYLAPGGATVRYFYFNPHLMWQAFIGNHHDALSSVGLGLLINIKVFLIAEVFILLFALLIAWTRMSKSPVLMPFRILATLYTDVFRGIPVLLVFLLIGFGVPGLKISFISYQSEAVYGCIALIFTYSAYVSEVLRAGIYSVPNGQLLAARSLGLTNSTTMRRIILPQAVRTVIPPLLNDFISLQKDTALLSVLGVIESVQAGTIYQDFKFNSSGLVVASLLFLIMTIPLTRFTDGLIARDRSRRLASS
ncbi:MAG: amino acid ABC transporter permease [Acidimicrobiales bacterium]